MKNFVSYTALAIFGAVVAFQNNDWFFSPASYYQGFPGATTPESIRWYYMISIGHYIFSAIHMFWEPALKDFYQLLTHHFVTVFLQLVSFYWGLVKYGAAMMLLHDIADPFIEVAKLSLYCNRDRLSDFGFITFTLIFFYTRLYLFPSFLIQAVWKSLGYGHWYMAINKYFDIKDVDPHGLPVFWPILFALCTLQVMHIIWAYMVRLQELKLSWKIFNFSNISCFRS